jgi:hypothetical protein
MCNGTKSSNAGTKPFFDGSFAAALALQQAGR